MELDPLRKNIWFDGLTLRLFKPVDSREQESLADIGVRTILVAKTRWILLLLFGLYGIGAASLYALSSYGFFLSPVQLTLLFFCLAAVCGYNYLFRFHYDKLRHLCFINRLQISLDILFATILVYLSGGASSWFWPVYQVVMIEAAFLLEKRRNVFLVGSLASLLYGALLAAEYQGVLPHAEMPFVNTQISHDLLFNLLVWLWVAILNVTVALIGVFLMTVIRRENRALRASEERLVNFIDSASDLIHSVTPDGRLVYANRAWQQAIGYNTAEVGAVSLWDVIHPERKQQCMREFSRLMTGERISSMETDFQARDGRVIKVEGSMTCSFKDNQPVAIWGICRDITERKQAEEKLYHLAHHDILTGLPNRTLFNDRLRQARALAKRMQLRVGVLFLDLDRFKIINDTLGHPIGDKLLQEVAKRLALCVRETDTVARIGGDEFTIILVNMKDSADVERVAQKILMALKSPFLIEMHELFITTSIGISMYPTHGEELEQLVKRADIAMYHAKVQGRNNYQFYSPALDENTEKKLLLANSLRKALDRDELRIYYQPKFDIETEEITAFEALLRWEHPEMGLLYPADFIPLAEEIGLIIPIGEWVLRGACRQNMAWQEEGLTPVRVAVNVSAYQFQQKDLVESVRHILSETGLEPRFLELEVTESIIMQNPESAVSILCELRDIGIHISIDDFGTGYSSLAHLKRFSVNTLKIDKSFVRDVEVSSVDAAIATAIIAMGNSLELKVIAEGVETPGQLTFLRRNNCDEAQGFLFSGPVPPHQVPEIIRDPASRFVRPAVTLSTE